MRGEKVDAVRSWIIGQSFSPTENFFFMIKPYSERYGWDFKTLHFAKIKPVLEEYSNEISSSLSFEAGFELLKEKFKKIRWRKDENSRMRKPFTRRQYQVLTQRACDEDENWRGGHPQSSPPTNGDKHVSPSRRRRRRIESSSPTFERFYNSTSKENQDSALPTSSNSKYIPPGRRNKDREGATPTPMNDR